MKPDVISRLSSNHVQLTEYEEEKLLRDDQEKRKTLNSHSLHLSFLLSAVNIS